MKESIIKASGLVKHYQELTAVDGVDFDINPGETFGFLGPNGAGKTTIMKMIYGVIRRPANLEDVFLRLSGRGLIE